MDSKDIERWRIELDDYSHTLAKATTRQLIPIFVTPRKW